MYLILITRRLVKLNRKILLTILINFSALLAFGGDIVSLEKDVMNYSKEGYRLQSLGDNYYITAQGSIKEIDYKYAFCICGKGFFVVQNQKKEIFLTRNGFFKINKDGLLINQDGYLVLGVNSDIQKKKYEYISSDMIADKNQMKPTGLKRVDSNSQKDIDYFLIMEPKVITSFHEDYVSAKETIKIKTYIRQYAREAYPVSFEQLLDLAIEIFKNTKNDVSLEKKKKIFYLLEYQKEIIFNEFFFNDEDKLRLEMKLEQIKKQI